MRLYRDHRSGTIARARDLRRNAPEPERRLLRGLRQTFPEAKWRHQAPIGRYYADILCLAERLVIEVDGDTHANTEDHDVVRTRFLAHEGFTVIRFANTDVTHNLDGVLTHIAFVLRKGEGDRAREKGGTA